MAELSLVMGVFNAQHALAAAIESILNQTFRSFEFIIVDDGSYDGSDAILRHYAAFDKRIHLIRQPHRGLTAALNVGLAAADGSYIARQDADDISLPTRLEMQLQFMKQNPTLALTGTDFEIIDDDTRHLATVRNSRIKRLKQHLKRSNPFVHGSIMFRSVIDDRKVVYDEFYEKAQDYDLILRIAEKRPIRIIPHVLYRWRFSKHGILATNVNIYGERARYNFRRRRLNKPEDYAVPSRDSVSAHPCKWAFERALAERYFSAYRRREARWCYKRAVVENDMPAKARARCLLGILLTFLPTSLLRSIREW
jgi:glycosyltransferase involved in cell wall biosynthesis